MYRITNTIRDRQKTLLHRTAPGVVEEPVLGSHRIRLGESYDITDAHYERVKNLLDSWVKKGMVSVTQLGDTPAAVLKDMLAMPSVTRQVLPAVPVEDAVEQARLASEIVKAKEMAAATAEIVETADTNPVVDTLSVTTEPAGAPAEASQEESQEQKRGPGRPKKKLF